MNKDFKTAKEIIEEMIKNGELPNCEFANKQLFNKQFSTGIGGV